MNDAIISYPSGTVFATRDDGASLVIVPPPPDRAGPDEPSDMLWGVVRDEDGRDMGPPMPVDSILAHNAGAWEVVADEPGPEVSMRALGAAVLCDAASESGPSAAQLRLSGVVARHQDGRALVRVARRGGADYGKVVGPDGSPTGEEGPIESVIASEPDKWQRVADDEEEPTERVLGMADAILRGGTGSSSEGTPPEVAQALKPGTPSAVRAQILDAATARMHAETGRTHHPGVTDDGSTASPGHYAFSDEARAVAAGAHRDLFRMLPQKAPQGSNPAWFMEGPGKTRWFVKAAKRSDRPEMRSMRAAAEASVSRLLAHVRPQDTVPVGQFEHRGEMVSAQPFVEGAKPLPSDPSKFSPRQKGALLANHALDMWVGDHDGNQENGMVAPHTGMPFRIDRGQAFKPQAMSTRTSLDPSYRLPGNFGAGYTKGLLKQWGSGKADIPPEAFAEMQRAIHGTQAVPDGAIDEALTHYAAGGGPAGKVAPVLKRTRDTMHDDWTQALQKLRPGFQWPEEG
jgi:hypothetical protein